MSSVNAADAARLNTAHAGVLAAHRRQFLWPVGILALVVGYLAYAFFAFDIPELVAKSRLDRGVLLGLDSVAYKVHVEKNLRRDRFEVAVEGERTATYQPGAYPDWIAIDGANGMEGRVDVDMGDGEASHGKLQTDRPALRALDERLEQRLGQRLLESRLDEAPRFHGPQPQVCRVGFHELTRRAPSGQGQRGVLAAGHDERAVRGQTVDETGQRLEDLGLGHEVEIVDRHSAGLGGVQ